jgi:hypothetical protein
MIITTATLTALYRNRYRNCHVQALSVVTSIAVFVCFWYIPGMTDSLLEIIAEAVKKHDEY